MAVSMGRKRGLAKVRLDCFLANTRLISFYERNGFSSVGTTVVNGKMLNLMERVIATNRNLMISLLLAASYGFAARFDRYPG